MQELSVAGKYGAERRYLSPFAAHSDQTKGRRRQISPDHTRTEYERDYHRILFSLAFSRLRHKTQVFYAPANDHICTRMEHALHVVSISATICRQLGLNVDLANAIALGHDLGHAPFGHTGEEALDELSRQTGLGGFAHEANSLRVVDVMKELNGAELNLTYEVRDGIVCHCGEDYTRVLEPEWQRDVKLVDAGAARLNKPCTLEGCVVRYVDRVAYLARDLQDALALGVLGKRDIPRDIPRRLGTDAGEIIGRLASEIIVESMERPHVAISQTTFDCMREFYRFSMERIYGCDLLAGQRLDARRIIAELFHQLLEFLDEVRRNDDKPRRRRSEQAYRQFLEFLHGMHYPHEERPEQVVLDFMAGLTDTSAIRAHRELFPGSGIALLEAGAPGS